MKKRQIFLIVGIFASTLFIGCSFNILVPVKKTLDVEYCNYELETKKVDISQNGKCPGVKTLNVINAEARNEKYNVVESPGEVWYLIPVKFMELVEKHAEEKLIESHLIVDEVSGNKILISLEKIEVDWNVFYHSEATVILKIQIPEINYTQYYKGKEGSAMSYNAISYATHLSLVKFLNDPVFQKYVKCE